jgi:hypothetical protein
MSMREVFKVLGDKATTVALQCDNIASLSWMREFHPNAGAVGDHQGTHGIPQAPKSVPNSMRTAIGVVRAMKPSRACLAQARHGSFEIEVGPKLGQQEVRRAGT